MAKSRRPANGYVNPLEKMTKVLLVDLMEDINLRLVNETIDKGEWNERRVFYAVHINGRKTKLDVASKGETPDWQYMHDQIFGKY